MAEEIVSQEAELDKGTPDFQDLNNQAINKINAIESSLNLPARPTAIDSYQNVAGNPITGSNPGSKDLENINNYINSQYDKIAADRTAEDNILGAMRPFTYNSDYDGAKFNRYHSSGDVYNKLGFSPYSDNEALYNDKMTFGDQFVRAAKQWDDMVGVGFMSGVRSWKTIFTDPLAPDIEGARDMERIMANAGSTTGGLGGFFTNTFLNSGYTVGIGLNFLGEELALMGATALTGGIMGAANVPTMMGRGLSAVNKIVEGGKAAFTGSKEMQGIRQMGNTIPEMKTWWNSIGQGAKSVVRETADILNPLDQTIDALRATDYATNYAKVAKTFGAFADDMLMMKGSVSEAKLEGGMVKVNLTNDLINAYRAKEGKNPEGQAMLDIEKQVDKEAFNVALWNLPAINTTNKLMYATVLAPLKNVMGKEGAVKLIDDYIFSNKTFSVVGEGFLAKSKAAIQSFKNPKLYGQFGMNYLKANVAEGVQENLQEVISKAASDHAMALYTDPIRASYEGYMPHVLKGFSDQFSAEGAETFAGGFAMGMFAQPAMGAVSVSMSKLIKAFGTEEYAALEKLKNEIKVKNVEHLNYLYQNDLMFLAPDFENAIRTGKLSNDLFSAAKEGNKKEALDAIQGITDNYLMTGIKTGKIDVIIDKIKQYKNLSKDEVAEAFGKYGIKTEDVDKALGKIDGIVNRAEQLKKDYADVAENYPNPINPYKFVPGTPERKAADIAYKAWETAKYNLIFAKATFSSNSKRIAEVAQIFSGISNDLAKSDAQNLMTLLNPTSTKAEIGVLKKEIAVLDESNPEQKKVKAEKIKQLEKITSFYEAVESIKSAKNDTEKAAAELNAKKAFGEYVKFLAKKNDNIVFNEDINKAYSVVKDYMSLKDDMKGLAESINVLMTPENFFEFHARLNQTYTDIVDNKQQIIENNQNSNEIIKNIQEFANLVTKKTPSGLQIPNEIIVAYVEALKSGGEMPTPTYFVDLSGSEITSGPDFDIAMDLWKGFINVTVKPKVEAPVNDLEAKKADIERRREEELDNIGKKGIQVTFPQTVNFISTAGSFDIGSETKNSTVEYTGEVTEEGTVSRLKSKSLKDVEGKLHAKILHFKIPGTAITLTLTESKLKGAINAKYDAELKALENKPVETPKTPEDVIEAAAKRLIMQPRETLTAAEEKALRFGLPGSSTLETRKDFIQKRMELLEKKADALGLDANEVTDTLNYLNNILNTSVDSTHDNLKQIEKQLDVLINSIKSKGAKKTARGVKALDKIAELKLSYRSEFQLLNDITDRVKELQEELSDIEAVQKDLQKQAQYYQSLLADSSLSTYTREELTARRDKLNGKINTIGNLLEAVKQAIYDSIKYIREHVNALFENNKNIKTFISENEYENFQYPNIKNKIESLQNEALNNMESIEFLEEVKTSEETKQAQLLNALLNYQDQVRYLEELIYNYKEGEIKDKFDNMTLNAKEVVAEKQPSYPVTISRKNTKIQNRLKEAKAQNKEVEQAESVVVTPEVGTLETTPTEITVTEFSLEEISPQSLNEDITLKNLRLAKTLDYEVIYDNIQYKIENIGTNSVTLKTALGKKEVVNEPAFKDKLRIVKPGISEATIEENEFW
jgi:predicted RNA-binding protein with EMAP domain